MYGAGAGRRLAQPLAFTPRGGISERLGVAPKHVVVTVDEFGNTASTTHFVALRKYLGEGRFAEGDRVLLLALASGLEVGIIIFKVDQLVGRYGHDH